MSVAANAIARIRAADESHKELGRFLIVGGSGTLINFAVLTATYHYLHWPAFLAALLSNETAMVINFFCHEHWTFSGQRHGTGPGRLVRYQFVALGGIAISTIIFTVLVHLGMFFLLANALAICVALTWNFGMSRRWAWRRVPAEVVENVA
jgi:dolichol-phosphate mannosyltransferase